MALPAEARRDLDRLGGVRVRDDPDGLVRVGRDQSHLEGVPAVHLLPETREAVAAVVRWARRHRIALVPRGGGTSLDGESVAVDGGALVDLSGWTSVAEVDPIDRIARVAPGVVNFELQRVLAPHGLFFPPNPGSWRSSTIGGNVATNASGPRSFRYGPTRAWVRSLELVLGTGELLSVGARAAKRSIGPDLVGAFVGSEGTLGIVTEATVGLAPLPPRRLGLVVPLPSGVSLGRLVARLIPLKESGLAAVEYLDRSCAEALSRTPESRIPAGEALLLMEVESEDEPEEERRLERLRAALRASGVIGDPWVAPSADRLWSVRGESGLALDRELGARIREDVAVPIGRLDDLIGFLERLAREEDVRSVTFAHLGDGSLHPNLGAVPGTERGERLRARLLAETLRLGGTISAEHGIGAVKPPYLEAQVGRPGLQILRALKGACDPDGILNPGKLYPLGPTGAPDPAGVT